MFKLCRNLPEGHCVSGLQDVKVVSEPTIHKLWGRGAGCLTVVATYLPALCCRGAGYLSSSEPTCLTLCCRLFKRCRNLPPINCGAGVQEL